ncbi:hypothetical protein OGE23_002134 [Vibrio cholerae]|nr:hypothetical protein [Vibrio cholerae]EJY4340679.1 hypothetical protein [Vibrio cholerae]
MDLDILQDNYIKLLYQDDSKSNLQEGKELDFLKANCKLDRLPIERMARVRNLRTMIYKTLVLLSKRYSSVDMLPLVVEYCNSSYFVEGKGRNITENFCLFIYNSDLVEPIDKELALIDALLSTIKTEINKDLWLKNRSVEETSQGFEYISEIFFDLNELKQKGRDIKSKVIFNINENKVNVRVRAI